MNRLSIFVNSLPVKIDSDTAIPLNLLSPLFNDEASHSFSFSVPKSGNEGIFGHPDRMTNKDKAKRKLPIRVVFDSYSFEGVVSVTSAGEKYDLYILTGLGALMTTLKESKLTELDLGVVTLGTTQATAINGLKQLYTGANEGFCRFPVILNPGFFADKNEAFGGVINRFDENIQSCANNVISETGPVNYNASSPCYVVYYIINKVFIHAGINLDNTIERHPELSKLIMISMRSLDYKEKKYVVSADYTTYQDIAVSSILKFNRKNPLPLEDLDSCYNTTSGKYEVKHIGFHQVTVKLSLTSLGGFTGEVVTFTLSQLTGNTVTVNYDQFVVNKVGLNNSLFETTWLVYQGSGDVGKYLVVVADITNEFGQVSQLRVSGNLDVRNTSYLDWSQLPRTYKPADFMPPVPMIDLINAMRGFGLEFFPDNELRMVDIKFLKDILDSGDIVDWNTGLIDGHTIDIEDTVGHKFSFTSDSGDEALNTSDTSKMLDEGSYAKSTLAPVPKQVNTKILIENSGEIQVSYQDQDDKKLKWKTSDNLFHERTIENDEISQSFSFMPVSMTNLLDKESYILCISMNQKGNSFFFDLTNDYKIRFALFGGINAKGAWATSLDRNYNNEIANNLRLTWEDDNGIYGTFWRRWVEWRRDRARPVTFEKIFTPAELADLKWWRWVKLGWNCYLIDSITIELKEGQQPKGKIKAWLI